MRMRRSTVGLLLLVVAAGACGSDATGIMLSIMPDPIQAQATGSPSAPRHSAAWDVVLADLTGQGGRVESLAAAVDGAAVTFDTPVTNGIAPQQAALSELGPFDRRIIHQSASFELAGLTGTLRVTARFRAQDGQVYEATAEARVTAR